MTGKSKSGFAAAAFFAAAAIFGALAPASAKTIIDEWSSVKAPPPPTLKSVTVNPKTTAFLVLDLIKQICSPKNRPRCVAGLPLVKAFLAKARAHKMTVIYSITPNATKADIYPQIAPIASEPVVSSHADKFLGTNLDKLLKERHIKTVIVIGTDSRGAVLYTASNAALLGYKVIVPVDGSTSDSLYAEQATAWIMATAPGVGQQTTLTRFDMIGF